MKPVHMNSSIKPSTYDSETYGRIAKAIAFMRQNHLHQPNLATIAQHVHLSEYHFQRLFTRWAGISPKRFLQYLTVEYAKSKIAETVPLILYVKGTNFQIQVWRALLSVPFGGITTYQGLATAMGRPTAVRAVGNALGNNPVGYLIPCHRAIRESGEFGGFRWELERKTVLLGWAASRNQTEKNEEESR
ncbi:MAG: methylated-DNA--[protein]-cysteine S-methyltransferase [Symploca sp. SIO2G7]|nr:methylated-DNA--[protein]-cysteine S-methyltransferase [Symploca sp. SIO2G7]